MTTTIINGTATSAFYSCTPTSFVSTVWTTTYVTELLAACSTSQWPAQYTVTATCTGNPVDYTPPAIPAGFVVTTVTCPSCEPTEIVITCPGAQLTGVAPTVDISGNGVTATITATLAPGANGANGNDNGSSTGNDAGSGSGAGSGTASDNSSGSDSGSGAGSDTGSGFDTGADSGVTGSDSGADSGSDNGAGADTGSDNLGTGANAGDDKSGNNSTVFPVPSAVTAGAASFRSTFTASCLSILALIPFVLL